MSITPTVPPSTPVKLSPDYTEHLASLFLPRTLKLARTAAGNLNYADVEEFESIALCSLALALDQYRSDPEPKLVWHHVRSRVCSALRFEALSFRRAHRG